MPSTNETAEVELIQQPDGSWIWKNPVAPVFAIKADITYASLRPYAADEDQ